MTHTFEKNPSNGEKLLAEYDKILNEMEGLKKITKNYSEIAKAVFSKFDEIINQPFIEAQEKQEVLKINQYYHNLHNLIFIEFDKISGNIEELQKKGENFKKSLSTSKS